MDAPHTTVMHINLISATERCRERQGITPKPISTNPIMATHQTDQVEKTSEVTSNSTPDKEIAKPSGACCLQGTLHDGKPRGTTTTVAGIETYVVEPAKDKANGHVVLYFPDVWGFFNNGFLVMDGFADAGFLTLGLDYFRGVGGRVLVFTVVSLC